MPLQKHDITVETEELGYGARKKSTNPRKIQINMVSPVEQAVLASKARVAMKRANHTNMKGSGKKKTKRRRISKASRSRGRGGGDIFDF